MTATLEDVQKALDIEILIKIDILPTNLKSKELVYRPLAQLYNVIEIDQLLGSRKVRQFHRVETALKHYNNLNIRI